MKSFEDLISEAEAWEMEGWDFSSLKDRWIESATPWDYREKVLSRLRVRFAVGPGDRRGRVPVFTPSSTKAGLCYRRLSAERVGCEEEAGAVGSGGGPDIL
jgi:hypothetical protein